jgi:hypothetical protein
VSPRSEPRSALPNPPIHPIAYSSPRALPASPYASHAAIAIEPAPFDSHCTCPSLQTNRFAVVGSDSYLARCRSRAAILVVLATFGVVCHAQMTPQDASGVTSCETELASCQAVLDAVGTKKAEDVVPLATVTAETGTPSSASKGARSRSTRDLPSLHRLRTHRRQGAASVRDASPCRAESPALVSKNTSGAVQPADGAQYPESKATGCAAMLRDCQAHSRARIGATSPGEPRLILPFSLHVYKLQGEIKIYL